MDKQKQRIALATEFGWKDIRIETHEWSDEGGGGYQTDLMGEEPGSRVRSWIPDYTSDLNAMHEAEKTLAVEEWPAYASNLWLWDTELKTGDYQVRSKVHASAKLRAECFLRTKGLWVESEEAL